MKKSMRTRILQAAPLVLLFFIILQGCAPTDEYIRRQEGKSLDRGDKTYVRVLIYDNAAPVQIASLGKIKITELKGDGIIYDTERKSFRIPARNLKKPVEVVTEGSHVYVNRKPYRGTMELHNVLGRIQVVNILRLEEYLLSVVPSEIPSGWPVEALKAQAVAARTYAYSKIASGASRELYDLKDTTSSQVYKGVSAEKKETSKAVFETSHQVMTYKGKPITAVFHSTCGGHTASSHDVWKSDAPVPYLKGVTCGYCTESRHYEWEAEFPPHVIESKIQQHYSNIGAVRAVNFRKVEGRVAEVTILHGRGSLKMTGNEFRLLMDPSKVKSTFFTSETTPRSMVIHGRGWGHGVGMCQWGARGMAEKGKTYKEILSHYYTDIRIVQMELTR